MFNFTEPLQVAAAGLGLIIGIIYGLSGFRDDGRSTELSKNPRVKNLQWAAAGLIGVLIGDLRAISTGDPPPGERAILTGDYICGLFVGSIGVIAVTVIAILLIMRSHAKRTSAFSGRAGDAALEYLQYGYAAYRVLVTKIETDVASASRDAPASLGEFGYSLAAVMSALLAAVGDAKGPTALDGDIDRALVGIESVVKLFGSGVADLEVETNFMVVAAHADIAGQKVLFTDGRSLNEFASFLVLKRYRLRSAGWVCLPVDLRENVQQILPGAPIAAAETRAYCINTDKLEFRDQLSKTLRREIEIFFKSVRYKSVLSVPVLKGREVIGVVNIETNHSDVVGKGAALVPQIGRALAPYSVIMGESIGKMGVHHA